MWADRATDVNLATCSMTAEANSTKAVQRTQDPFWKVWFENQQIIKRITFQTLENKTGILSYT